MSKEILIEQNGMPLFYINACFDSITFEFEISKVLSCDMKNNPIEEELFLRGNIKYDHSYHLYFSNEEGYMYIDGIGGINYFKMVLDSVIERAINCFTKYIN